MDKELKTISECFNISENDVRIIYDIILNFASSMPYAKLKILLIKLFQSDIRPEHYIILGHLIGYCLATEETHDELTKQFSLCQRQN